MSNTKKRNIEDLNKEYLIESIKYTNLQEFDRCSRYFDTDFVINLIENEVKNELLKNYVNFDYLNKLNDIEIMYIERNMQQYNDIIAKFPLTINLILNKFKYNIDMTVLILNNFDIRGISDSSVMFDQNLTFDFFIQLYNVFQVKNLTREFFYIFLEVFSYDIDDININPKNHISVQKFIYDESLKNMTISDHQEFFENYEEWNISGIVKNYIEKTNFPI